MRDRDKTKDQLVTGLVALRQRVSELEASESRRALTEDARKQGEEWYRRIIETSYEGVWVIDAEWKTEYVNQRAAEMLGYTPEEMIGRPAFDFVYDADRGGAERRLERCKRGVGEQSEVRLRRKDGSELWVLSSTNPILDESGETIGVLGMMTDIAERKRAEEEFKESEGRFRATFEQAAVGIAHTALDGSWLRVNQRLCDILGYTREELLQKTFQDITYSDDLEPNLGYTEQLLAGEIGSFSMEKRYIRKDGSIVWGNLTVSLGRDPSGEPSYFIAVIEDITERKQAEKQRAAQYALSRLLAESPSLADKGQGVLGLVGMGLAWDYAGLWIVDPTEKVLRCVSTWHAPSIKATELDEVSRRMRFTKGEGQLGGVWASGKPAWIAGVNRRVDFLRREAALSAGLSTGLGYPIKVRKKVVGVLELFSCRAKMPDKDSIAAIKALSNQIGQFMERKRAEEELEKQMEILREQAQLLDLAHDSIMVSDMKGTITFWNRGAEETYGWTKEEALGETCHSLLKTEFPKPLEDIEEELFREGRWEGELVHTKRDGTQVVSASRWALQRDEHGQPLAILEINRDITEHKQLKLREHEARRQLQATLKMLRESEARFKRLAEVNIFGVIVTDSMNILEANEAFLRIVGYTHEDLLWADLHCDEITPPEYYPLDELAAEQLKRSGVCAPYKKEFIRKDGSRVPVLVGGLLSGEDQNNPVLFVLDLSERGRDEEALPEFGETEGRPIASVSQEEAREDLMAALQAMHDGPVDPEDLSLDGDLGQRLSGKELSALQLADARVRDAVADLRMRHLERERSFIRAAQPLAQDRPFLQAVEFLVELNRQIVPGCEIRLTVEDRFPSEIPVLTRLELLNILKEALVNARRHSEARCIWVTLGVGENRYWAEVADDGQGFDTRTPEEGAGIAEMRESAHARGGELEVDSQPGRGTRVRVWVPF